MHNCTCPPGFKETSSIGYVQKCEPECKGNSVYDYVTGLCVKDASDEETGGVIGAGGLSMTLIAGIIIAVLLIGGIGFGVYRYRIRTYMDKEIRSIMSQYMPLEDNQA